MLKPIVPHAKHMSTVILTALIIQRAKAARKEKWMMPMKLTRGKNSHIKTEYQREDFKEGKFGSIIQLGQKLYD